MFYIINIKSGGLQRKQGSESHENLVPPLARSIRRAIRNSKGWDDFAVRVAKTDGDAANAKIVEKAIDFLIYREGSKTIKNKHSGKVIDLEELKKCGILVCMFYPILFHTLFYCFICMDAVCPLSLAPDQKQENRGAVVQKK